MKITRLLFTVKEAAELLTKALGKLVNVQRVYYLIRMGRIAAFKVRRHLFNSGSVRVFLNLAKLFPASSPS